MSGDEPPLVRPAGWWTDNGTCPRTAGLLEARLVRQRPAACRRSLRRGTPAHAPQEPAREPDQAAEAVGLTFQQLQKYERGATGSAPRACTAVASVLKVPVGWFFEGLADSEGDAPAEIDPAQESCARNASAF
jgi:transcriptional regulator with XRE-family HTH domain